MASQAPRAKAHRPSVSRIVPAIPHALGPKARRQQDSTTSVVPPSKSADRPATPPASQDREKTDGSPVDAEDKPAATPSDAPNGSLTPPVDNSSGAPEEKLVEGAEASHDGQSQSVTRDVPSEPLEANVSLALPAVQHAQVDDIRGRSGLAALEQQHQPPGLLGDHQRRPSLPSQARSQNHKIVFGGAQEAENLGVTLRPSVPRLQGQVQSPTGSGPHPGAAPFIPRGQAYRSSESPASPSFPPTLSQSTFPHGGPRDYHGQQGPPAENGRLLNPNFDRGHFSSRRSNEHNVHPRFANSYGRDMPFPMPGPPPGVAASHDPAGRGAMPIGPPPGIGPLYEEAWAHGHHPPGHQQQPLMPVVPFPRDPNSKSDPRAGALLAGYIHSQFGATNYADHHIRVVHGGSAFAPLDIPGHGVLLARSPKLRSLMAMQSANAPGPGMPLRFLSINISDRFLNHELAFYKALSRLYAEELPNAAWVAQTFGPPTNPMAPLEHMRFALAYAAAGHFFQIDEIVSHGLDLAEGFLNWVNVEKALAFGLDGGLGSSWAQREGPTSEDRDSASSFDDSHSKLDSPTSAPTYGFYSDRLLYRVADYMAAHCPADFKFSATAPQLRDSPRLPFIADSTHARSKSSLARIRFGEMTTQDDEVADAATTTLSSVLVSLPFPLLKHLLEHPLLGQRLGPEATARLMRAVVAEREQRRQRAAQHRGQGMEVTDERLWQPLRWTENTEPCAQHLSGTRVFRHRLWADTPTSAASSKT